MKRSRLVRKPIEGRIAESRESQLLTSVDCEELDDFQRNQVMEEEFATGAGCTITS